MTDFVFACMTSPGKGAKEALMLARSIRTFAGELSRNLIWVLVPQAGQGFASQVEADFKALNVRLVPFALSEEARIFPFAAKTFAAAKAEALGKDEARFLVWMDRDSIVLQEPNVLRLPQGKVLGYRPVDHTLIGSPYDNPVDDFWDSVYRLCEVPDENIFPMITSVDETRIRPYFNAGLLVVRPEWHLLQSWAENFARLYLAPPFAPFYEKDVLYQIFVHQAILSGTILSRCSQEDLQQLPHLINYPLHMHNSYPADRRPVKLNELITLRYDTFFDDSSRIADLAIAEPLKSWLNNQELEII